MGRRAFSKVTYRNLGWSNASRSFQALQQLLKPLSLAFPAKFG